MVTITRASGVRLFEGSGATWTALYEINASSNALLGGLRFTSDASQLVVCDWGRSRLSLFNVVDGSLEAHIVDGLPSGPVDVEDCGDGWLTASYWPQSIFHSGHGVRKDLKIKPITLALVPGLGLVVRGDSWNEGNGNHHDIYFFSTCDFVAMASMSALRVGWMMGVARGTQAANFEKCTFSYFKMQR
jgi:hypothetical protein